MHKGYPCLNQPPRNTKKMAKKKMPMKGYTKKRSA